MPSDDDWKTFDSAEFQRLIDSQDEPFELIHQALLFDMRNEPLPDPLRRYVWFWIHAVIEGVPPDEAARDPFARKPEQPKRGRPRRHNDAQIAVWVHRLILKGKGRHKRRGGAYFEAGKEFHKSPSAIEEIYKKYPHIRIDDEWISLFPPMEVDANTEPDN